MAISKSQAFRGPEWMLKVALDDTFRVVETMFAKDGTPYEITRRATLKERLTAAKDASSYFAPKLQAVEHNVTSTNVEAMTDEELHAELAKAMKFLAPKQLENSDGGQGDNSSQVTQETGLGSARPVGEPSVQTPD